MCVEHVEEKRDLIRDVPKDRKLTNSPKITQVWSFFSERASFKHSKDYFASQYQCMSSKAHSMLRVKTYESYNTLSHNQVSTEN